MNPERFARLREILLTLPCLPEDDRPRYLDEECRDDPELRREVDAVLSCGGDAPEILKTGGVADLFAREFGTSLEAECRGPVPERIGPYAILGILGQGGMGVVYRARQIEPINRVVALKLLHHGLDSAQVVSRFEAERQTLALMDHPHIAKVLDAGSDDRGHLYFVMELVRGIPITDFCQANQSSLEERLELQRTVCLAVQHAHQKGIIHRDLKPSNILVTLHDGRPHPKLIDFGIAKALAEGRDQCSGMTQAGQLIGTLEYMSPEQAAGGSARMDTRSDVYSLGVILYELVTGELPYEVKGRTTLEALRAISADPPRRLKCRRGACGRPDGELETIILKALEKDPERRYSSAGALAEDLQRYLTKQPILARPPSTAYQLRKLIARHRGGFAAAVALPVLLIAFGVTMSAERHKAVVEEKKAEEISGFLLDMLSGNQIERGGRDVKLADVLDEGARRIEDLRSQPEVQAQVQRTLGEAYRTLGLYEDAERHLRSALATIEGGHRGSDGEIATILENLSEVLQARGELAEPESLLRRALALRARPGGEDRTWPGRCMDMLAHTLAAQGRYAEAEPLYHQALQRQQAALGDTAEVVATEKNNLAVFLWGRGRYAEAEPLYREALETFKRLYGERHTDVATMTDNLGLLLGCLGKLDEAESLHRRALSVREELLGAEHAQLVLSHVNLATCLAAQGKCVEAEEHCHRALEILPGACGAEHPWNGVASCVLGSVLLMQDECAEAERRYEGALALRRRVLPPGHDDIALSEVALAALWVETGRADRAEPVLRNALEALRTTLPEGHWRITLAHNILGRCLARLGRTSEAESLLVMTRPALLGGPAFDMRLELQRTAELYENWGRPVEAEMYRSRTLSVATTPATR